MSVIDTLLNRPDLYGPPGATFDDAMLACDRWHQARNPAYAALCGADARPTLPTSVAVTLQTAVDQAGIWLGTSGTSGPSRAVHFDPLTMGRVRLAMRRLFAFHGFASDVPVRFLILAPNPEGGPHAGYATAFRAFTDCAPAAEIVHGVDDAGRFDATVCWDTLARWSTHDAPIFIFGLTVFFEHLALTVKPLRFAGPVRGITGGGWKGLPRQLDRPEIVARLARALGADIRDLYGMTEHPIHYLSCAAGRFHVPGLARVSLVDARDGVGLLRLQSPLFASMPAHDLLTRDRGRLGTGCVCGINAPWFEFLGRVTSAQGTCAATARAGAPV